MLNASVLFLTAFVATISAASLQQSSFQPQAGFEYIGTAEGKIFLMPILSGNETYGISWQRALERCTSNGYRIATIDSQAQNDAIGPFIEEGGSTRWAWIDGTNFLSRDTFFSITTGKNLTYFNWAYEGLPVQDDQIRCLRWSKGYGTGMFDVTCDGNLNNVVCETNTA